jgi:hypothetical protein
MLRNLGGTGLRERVLTAFGAGDLYRDLREAKAMLAMARDRESIQLVDTRHNNHLAAEEACERLAHFQGLRGADRLIELDFPVRPRVRHGWGPPSEPRLLQIVGDRESNYIRTMHSFRPFIEPAKRIPPRTERTQEPHWINDWLPAFDAFSIYCYLALRNPAIYLEIGSGTSTKFARQAISDHGLRTRIISIDPHPRSEIDALCDEVIRSPLEESPLERFAELVSGDILFFDGSHRSFQNSDATVFFTEIVPTIRAGVLAGVHDIFLPDDYPVAWLPRFYSEQYLLACWLLAGDALRIELAIWYSSKNPAVLSTLDDLWNAPNLTGANIHGGIFWFTPQRDI